MNKLTLALLLVATTAFARDMSERSAFVRENPRPANCSRCEVDHKQALMNNGPDKKENMQWLSHEDHKAKTKDDFKERKAGKSAKY